MPQETGPPIIIPENGLQLSPAVWQVAIVCGAPILAAIAIFIPLVFIVAAVSTISLWVINYFWPPKYPPTLMHQPQSDQSTPQLYNNENT